MNPTKKFSERFLRQARGIIEEKGEYGCLDRLVDMWRNLVAALDISGVDTMLQVVYRSRSSSNRRKGKNKRGERGDGSGTWKGKKKGTAAEILTSQEEADLALAIEESLKSVEDAAHAECQHELTNAVAESIKHSHSTEKSVGDLGIVTGKGPVDEDLNPPSALQQSFIADTKIKTEHETQSQGGFIFILPLFTDFTISPPQLPQMKILPNLDLRALKDQRSSGQRCSPSMIISWILISRMYCNGGTANVHRRVSK